MHRTPLEAGAVSFCDASGTPVMRDMHRDSGSDEAREGGGKFVCTLWIRRRSIFVLCGDVSKLITVWSHARFTCSAFLVFPAARHSRAEIQ